jgi:uncharacterized protein with HEPN domain
MNENDITRLRHILKAANNVNIFILGYEREDLDNNEMLSSALIRQIEIIGEAASKLSKETRKKIPLPWEGIIGMRNKLIHAYFDINFDILWNTIQERIPELIEELQKIPELEQ